MDRLSHLPSVTGTLAHQGREREGIYALHTHCLETMVPYFFGVGHWNYARYVTRHVIEFTTYLDDEALALFRKGDDVC